MEVTCRGPFRASAFVWQPRRGAFGLTVVCKATFVLVPGESPFHVEPAAVASADVHHDADPQKSLAVASDFAPVKKRAEVLVTGHAHAPGGREVQSLLARVKVGDLDKAVAVFGDSAIALDNSFADPAPFAKMPLRWERASSGTEVQRPFANDGVVGHPVALLQNPVGVRMGRGARADARGRVALPNLRPVGVPLNSRWDVLPPVGFGPIAPDWPARTSLLGRHASTIDPRRAREWPLPADFDAAFFNAAPEDQRLGEITGEEELILENLMPGTPRLSTRLARVTPIAHAELSGGGRAVFDLRCDTLSIDTDSGVATLVWRGHIEIDHPERAARVVVAGQASTSVLSPAAAAVLTGGSLLFAEAPEVSETPPEAPETSTPSMRATVGLSGAIPGFVLPFAKKSPPSAAAPEPEPPPQVPQPKAGLPFAQAPKEAPSPPAPAITESAPDSEDHDNLETLRPGPPDPEEPAEPEEEPVFPEAHRRTVALSSWTRKEEEAPLPFKSAEPVAEDYPVQLCARIAAKIACHPQEETAILERHGLSIAGWESLSTHWAAEIRKETLRDKQALLAAYDASYVEALESERGRLTPRDYADLVIAEQRGGAADLLDTMSIPRAALPRIRRTWLRKTVSDSNLATAVRTALRAAAEQ